MFEFVDVQKHHPYTREEAINLRTTHFWSPETDYYMPLAYNFNVAAASQRVNDYYKFFDTTSIYDNVGSAVTITGTAFSMQNLPVTPVGYSRILLYLKFRVKPTTIIYSSDTRRGKLYFDPTFICYNGINITKDRGNRLLEKYPIPGDQIFTTYQQSFRDSRIPNGVSFDNMKYFNPG